MTNEASEPDDRALLIQWRAGDAEAGRTLFDRNFRSLRRFFTNKVDEGVEDLIQSTMLKLVASGPRLAEVGNFRAYLFAIARHELFAALRARARAPDRFDSALQSAEAFSRSPGNIVARREENRLLLAALRKIPIDYQLVVELYYWEDLRTAELAEALELNPSTVTSRLARARELLLEQIAAASPAEGPSGRTEVELAVWAAEARAELDGLEIAGESQ